MRCSHCQSLMFEAETTREGHTEQILFECPICCSTHLCCRRLSTRESGEQQNRKGGEYRLKAAGIPG